jgi:hypothetical protein
MPAVKAPHRANAESPEPVVSLCQEVRGHLENTRDRLCQEITLYPTPIPACDVHFNRLLEERAKLFQELGRLDALCQNPRAREHDIASVEDFIRSSEALNEEDRCRLASALKIARSASDA